MRHDFESSEWADNHAAVSAAFGSAIDKLAYVVGSIIAHRRADERKARRTAQFGC